MFPVKDVRFSVVVMTDPCAGLTRNQPLPQMYISSSLRVKVLGRCPKMFESLCQISRCLVWRGLSRRHVPNTATGFLSVFSSC